MEALVFGHPDTTLAGGPDGALLWRWSMVLAAITAGTWVLSSCVLLMTDRPVLGRLLVLLGSGLWAAALMTMLGVHSLMVLGHLRWRGRALAGLARA